MDFSLADHDLAAPAEDSYNEEDEDSCGSTVGAGGGGTGLTPPDSPQMHRERPSEARSQQYTGKIIPELDIYAIPSKEGTPLFVSFCYPLLQHSREATDLKDKFLTLSFN